MKMEELEELFHWLSHLTTAYGKLEQARKRVWRIYNPLTNSWTEIPVKPEELTQIENEVKEYFAKFKELANKLTYP